MNSTIRAYIDLTRLQFSFAWPLLFCSGYLLATTIYGGFSWFDLLRVALIGFFGFEAGLVLNDYIDRDYDSKDVEKDRLPGTGGYSERGRFLPGSLRLPGRSGCSSHLHSLLLLSS